MTIQKKTALLFTGITATILIIFSLVAFFFMNLFGFRDFYKRLEIRGIITAKAELGQHPDIAGNIYKDIRLQHLETLPEEEEYIIPIDSLNSFTSRHPLPMPPVFYKEVLAGRIATYKKGHVFYTGLIYNHGNNPYAVIVGARNEDSERYARNLLLILILSCLAGTIIAYTTGIFFSRITFKPVRDIINRVNTISVNNLHLRLEDNRDDDEITELASTFNQMLSRLETSFETQNNFVSNASHELRTPLTAIYGEADLALSRQRNADDYRRSLEVVLLQAEKLRLLTDSLLSLAQTGFNGKKHNMEQMRVDELLLQVKETINKINPDNKIHLHFEDLPEDERSLSIVGEPYLLRLGFSNVMENACKYSNNADVDVNVTVNNNRISIKVRDRGIGIPQADLVHIYDPFFRASNTRNFEGYGIGLPLTRNIFRLHQGSINVFSSQNEGTTVLLTLPVAH